MMARHHTDAPLDKVMARLEDNNDAVRYAYVDSSELAKFVGGPKQVKISTYRGEELPSGVRSELEDMGFEYAGTTGAETEHLFRDVKYN